MPSRIALASVYESQQNTERAVEVYRTYLDEVDPRSHEIRQRLVKLYLRTKSYPEALALLEAGLADNPHDLDAQLRVALIYGELKQYPKAIARLERLLAAGPGEVKVRDYLGLMYEETERYEKALDAYEANVKVQPNYYDGRISIARWKCRIATSGRFVSAPIRPR